LGIPILFFEFFFQISFNLLKKLKKFLISNFLLKKFKKLWILIRSIYSYVLRTNLISDAGSTQNCTKMLRKVTFVIQIAYFCIRPNTRRETKTVKFLLFVATFGQLPLQKATFFGSTYLEISSNLWQALLTDRQPLFKHD